MIEALDEPLAVTHEEDAELRQAMDQLDAGEGRPLEEVLARAHASLERR